MYQPYGRVSARDRDRRRVGWDLRFTLLMIFPIICLVVVLYEFTYLQQYTTSEAQDAQLNEGNSRLRVDTHPTSFAHKISIVNNKSSVVKGRKTMILIANYRDSKRCSETLKSIFENAVEPNLLKISIFDQIYVNEGEKQCVEVYCDLVGESCRRSQIVSSVTDAKDAKGPTVARYETEKAIGEEDFCLAIDSHLLFVSKWDEKLIAQWDATENSNAIITVYPKSVEHMNNKMSLDMVQLMCISRIESDDKDAMIQYGAPIWIDKASLKKPRLMSQLAGGFNFGNCQQAKEIRNDPYTPYLFHGEEYSRATRLWTSGYDFYVPSEDVVYHWYEPRKVVWERDWGARYVIQQKSRRRIRFALGLPVSREDFDKTELENFTLGKKRTLEQWQNFSGINPLASFVGSESEQFKNCGELELVSF